MSKLSLMARHRAWIAHQIYPEVFRDATQHHNLVTELTSALDKITGQAQALAEKYERAVEFEKEADELRQNCESLSHQLDNAIAKASRANVEAAQRGNELSTANLEIRRLQKLYDRCDSDLLTSNACLTAAGHARIKAEDELREQHRKIEQLREELDAARKDALHVRERVTDFFTMAQWRRPLFGETLPSGVAPADTAPISMTQKMRATDLAAVLAREALRVDQERMREAQAAVANDTRSEEEKKAAADIAATIERDLAS